MTTTQLGLLAAMGTALLWTLSALAWTSAGKTIGAVAVSFIRLPLACVFLAAWGWASGGAWLPLGMTGETWAVLAASGFSGFFLADLCLFKSFLLIGPRLSLLIYSLVPPLTALGSWLALGDRLGQWDWLAMGVILAGVAWVLIEQPEHDGLEQPRRRPLLGLVLAVLGAAGQSAGNVLAKQAVEDCDPVGGTLVRILGALAGYVVLLSLAGRWPAMTAAVRHGREMAILAFGALVGPSAGVVLYMIALRHQPAGVVATVLSTMPVLILPFVILLYHEKVSLRAAGGAVLSVLGVALLAWK